MAASTQSPISSTFQVLFQYSATKKSTPPEPSHSKRFDLSKPQITVSIPPDTRSTHSKRSNSIRISPNILSLLVMAIITLGIPSFLWGYASSPSKQVVQPVQAAEQTNDTLAPEVAQSNPFTNLVTITVEPTSIPVPTPQLVPQSTEQQARSIAREFNINEDVFVCTLRKESGLNSTWSDGTLKCGDGGRSCGIAQIQLGTWRSIRKHAGWSQDDLRADDIESMRTAAYGISTLWRYHWTGYKLCTI